MNIDKAKQKRYELPKKTVLFLKLNVKTNRLIGINSGRNVKSIFVEEEGLWVNDIEKIGNFVSWESIVSIREKYEYLEILVSPEEKSKYLEVLGNESLLKVHSKINDYEVLRELLIKIVEERFELPKLPVTFSLSYIAQFLVLLTGIFWLWFGNYVIHEGVQGLLVGIATLLFGAYLIYDECLVTPYKMIIESERLTLVSILKVSHVMYFNVEDIKVHNYDLKGNLHGKLNFLLSGEKKVLSLYFPDWINAYLLLNKIVPTKSKNYSSNLS